MWSEASPSQQQTHPGGGGYAGPGTYHTNDSYRAPRPGMKTYQSQSHPSSSSSYQRQGTSQRRGATSGPPYPPSTANPRPPPGSYRGGNHRSAPAGDQFGNVDPFDPLGGGNVRGGVVPPDDFQDGATAAYPTSIHMPRGVRGGTASPMTSNRTMSTGVTGRSYNSAMVQKLLDRYPVYKIDFDVVNCGLRIVTSKRRMRWRFGFPNPESLEQGRSGPACRGQEHDVVVLWSITSGKRLIVCDGQEILNATNRSGVLEHTWRMPNGQHILKVLCHASPPLTKTPGFRQYRLYVDGRPFHKMSKVYELGVWHGGMMPPMMAPVPAPAPVAAEVSEKEPGHTEEEIAARIREMMGRSAPRAAPPAPAPRPAPVPEPAPAPAPVPFMEPVVEEPVETSTALVPVNMVDFDFNEDEEEEEPKKAPEIIPGLLQLTDGTDPGLLQLTDGTEPGDEFDPLKRRDPAEKTSASDGLLSLGASVDPFADDSPPIDLGGRNPNERGPRPDAPSTTQRRDSDMTGLVSFDSSAITPSGPAQSQQTQQPQQPQVIHHYVINQYTAPQAPERNPEPPAGSTLIVEDIDDDHPAYATPAPPPLELADDSSLVPIMTLVDPNQPPPPPPQLPEANRNNSLVPVNPPQLNPNDLGSLAIFDDEPQTPPPPANNKNTKEVDLFEIF